MKKPRITKRFVDALISVMLLSALVLCMLSGCAGGAESSDAAETEAGLTQAPFVSPEMTERAEATPSASPEVTPTPTPVPEPGIDELIDIFIEDMSDEEKLGQLVMFGFGGKTKVSSEFAELMREYHIGNVIFYGNNVDREDGSGGFDTMAGLVSSLNEIDCGGIPRLYSIDIEGGSVHRFTWDRKLYGANELGSMSADVAREQFRCVGERLREVGINLDLAPVLDVSPHPLDTFLGTRIISADAGVTARIGAAAITGLHEGNCLATAKHFPGHGGTNADSHKGTPVVDRTGEELMGYDIPPFAAAVDAGVDCVLVAHIRYPALDSENIASLSPVIINGLLRETLGFDGIVISDDFRMEGLLSACGSAEAAVRFILSGGDIILCGANHAAQREIMEGLYEGLSSGRLTEERINESVHRILYAKYSIGIWEP